jgi:hypothetical protein
MKTTQDLVDKYGITKQGLLKRVEFLELKPETGSRGAFFFTDRHQQILDELDAHLKAGKAMESFIPLTLSEIVRSVGGQVVGQESQIDNPVVSQLPIHTSFSPETVPDAIVKETNDWLNLNQRIKYYWLLESFVQSGWGLTREEIKELTDCNVKGDRYTYDCFIFIKAGKVKGKTTWQVRKKSL